MNSQTKTTIDLKKFCASEDSRWGLTHPWTHGDFTYATNGHVIVRVPAQPDVPADDKCPDATKLQWDAVVTEEQWISIQDLDLTTIDCDRCNGGETPPHGCPDCNCDCEKCDDGKVFKETAIKVGSKTLNPRYLSLIRVLPGVLVAPDATQKTCVVPFKFDGGQGLLMPMKDKDS